jgi:glycosyltransferase involved in cell wall biosynthesis
VLGEAALFVEPDDAIGMAAAMKQVAEEPGLRTRLAAAGIARAREFRWESGARRVYEAYKAATTRPRRQQ